MAEIDLDLERERARARMLLAKSKERGAFTRFAGGTSRGVAQMLGAPVDIISAALGAFGLGNEAPLGGSANIQSAFEKLGVGPSPEEELGRAGNVGEFVGMTSVAAPALIAGGLRSLATQVLTRQPTTVGGLVQDIAKIALKSPTRFAASEISAATGAGLAGFEAAQRFPDSLGAQALAEIGGGFATLGILPVMRLTVRATDQLFQRIPLIGPRLISNIRAFSKEVISGLTTSGGRKRAIKRIQRTAEDPEATLASLERTDILPKAKLSPAQLTENENLLSLERSVMAQSEELLAVHQAQFADVNTIIRESLLPTTKNGPVSTQQVKNYFEALIDTRIRQAAVRADERLAELGPNATREDLNNFARQELLAAKRAARQQEVELYANIPPNTVVPTESGQEALSRFSLELGKAQQSDIPEIAFKFLSPSRLSKKGKPLPNPNFLGPETTIKEIRSLQGKLREVARVAASKGKGNRARIANEIADSLKDDIANSSGSAEVKENIDIAVRFSRDLNERFTRGSVGKLLARDARGGEVVPSGLTLETTVGVRSPRAREDTDALLEAVRRNGDEPAMRNHIEGFLIDDFRRSAVSGGRVDVNAAQRWLSQNQDVLARFPELRRSIERVKTSGGRLNDVERVADPKISRAAIFINAPPGTEITRIINTGNPKKAMQELVVLARQDPTGKAEQGLKAAFMKDLLDESQLTNSLDINDRPFISGSRLAARLQEEPVVAAMEGLFNKAEMKRINQIKQTAILIERARKSPKALEGVIGDKPGVLVGLIARIGGAQMGRFIAGKTGGGTVQTPGILAAQSSKLINAGVRDPARRLLTDAIQDESLFKSLLIGTDTFRGETIVRTKLNAWALGVLAEQEEIESE